MIIEELLDGAAHDQEVEHSRKLAMAAGLTKSSEELKVLTYLAIFISFPVNS